MERNAATAFREGLGADKAKPLARVQFLAAFLVAISTNSDAADLLVKSAG
jgi:hypothetical protein